MVFKILSSISLVAFGVVAANADLLYDNLGKPTTGYDNFSSAGAILSDSFSVGATPANVHDIFFSLLPSANGGAGQFTVGLYWDALQTNAIVAKTYSDSSATWAPLDLHFSNQWLNANTRYWIGINVANSNIGWNVEGTNAGHGVANEFYYNSGGLQANTGGPYQASVQSTPAPGAILTFALGFLARKRRRA